MNSSVRSVNMALISVLLLSAVNVVSDGTSPVKAASTTCKTVTKHGKTVHSCKGAKRLPFPTNPSQGLPSVTVTPTSDSGRSVTKTVSPDGGTVSTTGADGTVYTLSFSKDSLGSDQVITMTPLAAVNNLPGKHPLAAGVQLDPQGLQLGQPATLTIKLATPIPPANQLSFASEDSGVDFHLYQQTYDPQTITMKIVHFTEYGVFPGSASDLFAQMKYGTLSYQSLAEQFRAALGAMHQAQVMAAPEPYTWNQIESQFVAVQEAWYQQKVLPQMELAVDANANDDQVNAAISEVFQWEHSIQLLGVENADLDAEWVKLQDMVKQAIVNAYARAYTRCVNNHDLAQISRLSQLAHFMALMGYDVSTGTNFIADYQKCWRFELDVDATYTSHASGNGTTLDTSGHVQVMALPLVLDGDLHGLGGAKQIDYLQFSASGGNATCSFTPIGTTLGDPFGAHLRVGMTSAASPIQLTLTVSPGTAQEHAQVSCPKGQYVHVFDYSQFTGLWDDAAGLGHTFTDWKILGGSTYATYSSGTKSFTYQVGGVTTVFTLSTTLTLRHTPG